MSRWISVPFAAAFVLFTTRSFAAATYYVAPGGSDSATGTITAPFASWAHAQTVVSAGDTVYFRGGTYKFTDALSTCSSQTATVNNILVNKSGTQAAPIHYFAYPGEHPLFDFSGVSDTTKYSCRQVGVNVKADWLHIKGIEFKGVLQLNNLNHESWCIYLTGGSNNVFEQLDAHHNMGPGFFIQAGSNNTFLNCDSHENEDTLTSNGDGQSADGFGCHPNRSTDTNNVFHGCRAWWNSDDGWDFINSQGVCKVEYSWAWYNGYKPDAITNGAPVSLSAGNGNGFKSGGYGLPATGVPTTPPQHVVQMNAAFYNKANGFYANHSPNSPIFYNNTSYKNGVDFDMLGVASDGSSSISVGILRNNLAYAGTLTANMGLGGGLLNESYNSWDSSLSLTVANSDFQSVAWAAPASCPQAYVAGGTPCVSSTDLTTFAGMASARQADGSLPVLPFLRPSSSGHLIARGVNVGLPYSGTVPDLGCFQTSSSVDSGVDASSDSSADSALDSATDTRSDVTADTATDTGATTDVSADSKSSDAPVDATIDSTSTTSSADSGSTSSSADSNVSADSSKADTLTSDAATLPGDGSSTTNDGGSATADAKNGCSCSVASTARSVPYTWLISLALAGFASRRRRVRQ